MISIAYLSRKGDDPEAHMLLNRFQSDGYDQLHEIRIEKVFRLEGIPQNQVESLRPLLCNPAVESLDDTSVLSAKDGPILEVGYQRAVTDPELPSILRGAEALDVHGLEWARLAHRYQFIGVDHKTARQLVDHYLFNPQVQVILEPGESWSTLKPQGNPGIVEDVELHHLSDDELLKLSDEKRLFLDLSQMKALQEISDKMQRPFTDAEIEMFAQTWSDHCFHTTWKSLGLLKMLWDTTVAINHPLVLSVFEDNAGVMEFYDGWALTIKGETHNSPSAVSPYGGIMTKHGGVIRDTLGCGQGAKPIGGSTVMGLGNPLMKWDDVPEGASHPKTILLESIRGTADYTNPMGIPMMFPVYKFHPNYTGKCFALGHSIGFLPKERAPKGKPEPGDLAILVGGRTGMDGLHGATVSSDSMTSETSVVDAAHVQIGHPIEERKFMEAIPVLRDQNCLRAITDLGAAGLSSALGEMGENTGVWVNLAWVPLKTEGMHPWEIWISESQERMMLCVPREKKEEAFEILKRYEVPSAIVGCFTNTKRCQVIFDDSPSLDPHNLPMTPKPSGQIAVDLTYQDLRKGCPMPDLNPQPVKYTQETLALPSPDSWEESIVSVLTHINICDQSAAGSQFDKTVQGITAVGPYGGNEYKMPNDVWAATPIRGKSKAVVASVSFNPFYGDIDGSTMAKLMMLESIQKLVTAGVNPDEIVLCDNFYTPRATPEFAWQLKEMVSTCCEVSKQLGTPFISGKDSSNGTFVDSDGNRMDVPLTLSVMAMGRMPDAMKLTQKPWQQAGNKLYLIGPLSDALGGSVYLDTLSMRGTRLPDPDLNALQSFWKTFRDAQDKGWIQSASSIAEGGLVRRLFEMALGSGLGCTINLDLLSSKLNENPVQAALFGEMIGASVVEVKPEHASSIETELGATLLGEVDKANSLNISIQSNEIKLMMSDLEKKWETPFRKVVA